MRFLIALIFCLIFSSSLAQLVVGPGVGVGVVPVVGVNTYNRAGVIIRRRRSPGVLKGAAIGALAGGAMGAIGRKRRSPGVLKGAAIGALAGGAIGAIGR